MNVSNTAYYKPLTTVTPSIQREGFDPSTEIEDPWYAPIEKVTPRKYHKYAQASLKEKLYGPEEEEEPKDDDEGDVKDDPVDPQNPDQPSEPDQPVEPQEPENPDQPVEEPENPDNPK